MAWLKLFRIAALPSALANVLIGFLLANKSWQPTMSLVWLLLASACLYLAGMVLNDVFDVEVDRKERPSRPLPSGAISLSAASSVGFGLLMLGIVFAGLASMISLCFAVAIAVAVYLYDGPLKRTVIAPVIMGSCRTLNILLGASSAGVFPAVAIWYAVAIGVFITGVTLLAKREAAKSQSATLLIPGGALMTAGLLGVVYTALKFANTDAVNPNVAQILPLAIGFICLPILRRLALAIATASGQAVQATVITSLRSLIIFDASMAMLIGNGSPVHSIIILTLLGASWLLGRATKLT